MDLCAHVDEGFLGAEASYLGRPLTPEKDEALQQATAVANLRAALMSKNSLLSLKADVLGDDRALLLEYLPKGTHSLSRKCRPRGHFCVILNVERSRGHQAHGWRVWASCMWLATSPGSRCPQTPSPRLSGGHTCGVVRATCFLRHFLLEIKDLNLKPTRAQKYIRVVSRLGAQPCAVRRGQGTASGLPPAPYSGRC